MKLVWDYATVN